MASTSRVLIISFFLLLFFACSNDPQERQDSTPEVMLLECKPIQWPDGSTSFSIYATIGTNQTKVANALACQAMEANQIAEIFPARAIVSSLDCSLGDSIQYFFMEKTEEGLKVVQSSGGSSNPLTITTFKDGKFYFN
jgi:hypothetical protein